METLRKATENLYRIAYKEYCEVMNTKSNKRHYLEGKMDAYEDVLGLINGLRRK